MYRPPDYLQYLFPPDYDHLSYEVATRAVMKWRNRDLARILYERDGLCWMPDCDGDRFRSDMHEAIRRSHVVGFRPKTNRLTVFNGYNTVLLCSRCHGTAREPAPEEIISFAADLYGKAHVLAWLESLPFTRTRNPLQWWIEENTVDGVGRAEEIR